MTVRYVNYHPETGVIYQSGMCPNKECVPPGPEGSEWIYDIMVRDIENHRVNVETKVVEEIK